MSETPPNQPPEKPGKQIDATGLLKSGSLTVVTGASGGTVTCSVTVDNALPITATATGPFALASCDDF